MRKAKDLTGKPFSRLTVRKRHGNDSHGNPLWLCDCECGNTKDVTTYKLTSGDVKSCGCLKRELIPVMIGKKFGKLEVLERVANDKHGCTVWSCKCDCGDVVEVKGASLRVAKNPTQSCRKCAYISMRKRVIRKCFYCGKPVEVGFSISEKYDKSFCQSTKKGKNSECFVKYNADLRRNPIEVKCDTCGEPIYTNQYNADTYDRHFCRGENGVRSECYFKSLKGKNSGCYKSVDVPCDYCGEPIAIAPYRLSSSEKHYCNRECHTLDTIPDIKTSCYTCGKELLVRSCLFDRSREHFCQSDNPPDWSECRKRYMQDITAGENHPMWKGGISIEPYCDAWADKEYKEDIKERDDSMCMNPDCWNTSETLCLHHIDYDKKNCSPSNLITLCASCNARANFSRENHALYYQDLMTEFYGFEYDEQQLSLLEAVNQ